MRAVPLALICAALIAACGSEQAAAPPLARVVVRVDDDGAKGPDAARSLTLRCAAASDSATCRALARLSRAELAPTPPKRACTMIYGGPETASVAGTLRGASVAARFSRVNGCEIARWAAIQPLLSKVR